MAGGGLYAAMQSRRRGCWPKLNSSSVVSFTKATLTLQLQASTDSRPSSPYSEAVTRSCHRTVRDRIPLLPSHTAALPAIPSSHILRRSFTLPHLGLTGRCCVHSKTLNPLMAPPCTRGTLLILLPPAPAPLRLEIPQAILPHHPEDPFNTAKLSPILLNRTSRLSFAGDPRPRQLSTSPAPDRMPMDAKEVRRRRSSSLVYTEPPESLEQLSDQSALPNLNAEWVNAKGECT
jgi:hypothetical protein